MRGIFLCVCILAASGCNYKTDIPLEYPTPPPEVSATPLAKLELKRDAELEARIAKIAEEAKGKVGVAAVVIETGEAALLNADQRFPMQSVYKLPIAMAVMDQVRRGPLELDEQIGVTKEDMVRPGMRSPLRDQNPNGGEFTIRELIRLSLVESDGTASDVLMRVVGGAGEVQSYLTQIGINDIRVVNTEKEIGLGWQTQYENWATPSASVDLLRWIENVRESEQSKVGPDYVQKHAAPTEGYRFIVSSMAMSIPGSKRLKGLLSNKIFFAHKTGTSGTKDGITAATNDIGYTRLANGRSLVIAVFASDSSADEKTREAVIAKIAKACWNRWNR